MWLAHFLHRSSLVRPDALALSDATRECTWRQLDERTSALAAGLIDSGVAAGDRILLLSANRIEVLELFFAAAKAGAVICPLDPTLPLPEIEYIASNLEPSLLFAERSILERLGGSVTCRNIAVGEQDYESMTSGRRLDPRVPRQSDTAVIFSTAATTGRPKAVVVSHRSIMACYTGMAAETGMSDRDIMLNPCPLFHGSMVIGLALLAAGGRVVLEREFTPQRFLFDVARLKATRAFLVPSMVRFVLAARAFDQTDLSSLQEIMHGGGPMPVEVLREALSRFPCRFRSVYGITEGGGPIALLSSSEPQPDASMRDESSPLPAGRMMIGAQIAVMDEAGRPLPPGENGEIRVRGEGLMDGYWRNPEATAKAITDGWLHTGDLGYVDRDGYVFLLDRKNDLIIRGGQNVYPAEIERVIRAEPGVADVAALGIPSADWGEVPLAFVVAEDGAKLNPASLIAACTRQLASYKRPVAVRLIDKIPRSVAGKILRRVLREQLGNEAAAVRGASSAQGTG
jgi:acyl-CoA synthetase (AMP-forming)/AMP-acid ligase II